MPQLMDTCIRNNLHEEGLVLLRHSNSLFTETLYESLFISLQIMMMSWRANYVVLLSLLTTLPRLLLLPMDRVWFFPFSVIWLRWENSRNPCYFVNWKRILQFPVVWRLWVIWKRIWHWYESFNHWLICSVWIEMWKKRQEINRLVDCM